MEYVALAKMEQENVSHVNQIGMEKIVTSSALVQTELAPMELPEMDLARYLKNFYVSFCNFW